MEISVRSGEWMGLIGPARGDGVKAGGGRWGHDALLLDDQASGFRRDGQGGGEEVQVFQVSKVFDLSPETAVKQTVNISSRLGATDRVGPLRAPAKPSFKLRSLFRRRIKSALLIDFDNVVGVDHLSGRFAREITHWLDWLEDGRFDPSGRGRALLERRVYWNDQNAKWREDFEALGFTTFECRSEVRGKKSAADMMIALDAQQMAYENPAIEEYIVLTTDTDFVPLLNKLEEREKQTVAAANPDNLSFRVYSNHADLVISTRDLRAAMSYERPRRWMQRQVDAVAGVWRAVTGAVRDARTWIGRKFGALMRWLKPSGPLLAWGSRTPQLPDLREKDLDRGAKILADIGRQTPGLPMSRKTIVRILTRAMPEFSTSGRNPHLGCGPYVKMLERMAERRRDLKLHRYRNGGTALSWRTPVE